MKAIIYYTPNCLHCDLLKHYLKKKGVEYEEYDISNDKEKQKELYLKTKQLTVPITDINGHFIVGFNKIKIDEAIGL